VCCVVAGCSGNATARPVFGGRTTLTHVIVGNRDGWQRAELDVVSGATTVAVATGDLGSGLYQATTPADANSAPVATVDGDVVSISLASTKQQGPSAVRIVLSSQVDWSVRLDGGATEESVDLTGARLAALAFGAGASRIDATLPAPVGTVPVTMSGGASSFQLHLPGGVPARVRFAGGAGFATVDGTTKSGIAGGTVVDTPDWPDSVNRYDIDNAAGVSALSLDRS
ncbi:MAG TPA: hypothetical protein VFX16_30515, partial [Pseudonocardiaceae bacterium]|nr:hypothetical protein [Pseudonocardiaceae bacterium]